MSIQTLQSTTNFNLKYEDSLTNAITRATALAAVCENEFTVLTGWFNISGAFGTGDRINVVVDIPNNGGGNNHGYQSGGKSTIHVDSQSLNSNNANAAEIVKMIFINELVEIFMSYNNQHGQNTWKAGDSNGEGLSQLCGILRFSTGHYLYYNSWVNQWLDTARNDYVTAPEQKDTNAVSFGCALLFLNYLRTQLGFTIQQIIQNGAATLAGTYTNLTGDSSNPFPFFKHLLDEAFPGTATNTGPNLDDPYPIGTLSFWDSKNTFGKAEVQDAVNLNNRFTNAFWLVLEGFNVQGWQSFGSPIPAAPTGPASLFPGISFTPTGVELEQPGNSLVPQRIHFSYDIGFTLTSVGAFTTAPQSRELDASIVVASNTFPAATDLDFFGAQDPYFSSINPQQNNVPWLSQDLRVFTATPALNNQPVAGGPTFTNDSITGARTYLGQLLTFLNNTYGDPTQADPFDITNPVLPGQTGAFTGDSSVIPSFGFLGMNINNYNFAIARVRLRGAPGSASNPVKVFFRLWITQTADTDYQTGSTYLSQLDTNNLPGWPLPDPDSSTIPFFATSNAPNFGDPNNPELGVGGVNNRPITVNSGDGHWAYFGCFLNVYDPSNVVNGASIRTLLVGTHHCLVAQIAYDDAPILSTNGVVASPGNSDKLAQRNLQITLSDNPGSPATHRIPQTFDLRPSPAFAGVGANGPDELMIDWGNTPLGSTASIYWPQVDATQVLLLASQLYGFHALSASDSHTIECKVTRGMTYIPIPKGSGQNFAGLLTVDLPPTVVKGQEFDVVVRRLTSRSVQDIEVPILRTPPAATKLKKPAAANAASIRKPRDWRYVVGAFQIKIPVSTKDTILPLEENTLAIFKWRLQEMSASNRWYPVLKRYISYLSARVDGLGGDPNSIAPSPGGISIKGERSDKDDVGFTGKVSEVFYDCFGDFEGFVLRTCCARHTFRTREQGIEKVVLRASKEQSRLSVYVCRGDDERIERIVVDC